MEEQSFKHDSDAANSVPQLPADLPPLQRGKKMVGVDKIAKRKGKGVEERKGSRGKEKGSRGKEKERCGKREEKNES